MNPLRRSCCGEGFGSNTRPSVGTWWARSSWSPPGFGSLAGKRRADPPPQLPANATPSVTLVPRDPGWTEPGPLADTWRYALLQQCRHL